MVKLISLSELRAAEGSGRSRFLDAYKTFSCRELFKELPWLLINIVELRKEERERSEQNEPVTVNFHGGRNDYTEANIIEILSLA